MRQAAALHVSAANIAEASPSGSSCTNIQCLLGAPVGRVHPVDSHNLTEGRPEVAGAWRTLLVEPLATTIAHTSAHRGCLQLQPAALGQHNAAAAVAVEGKSTGLHTQPVLHSLGRHRCQTEMGPNTAAGIAARRDLGDCIADTVAESSSAAGCAGMRSLDRCCMQPDGQQQSPRAGRLQLLGQLGRNHFADAVLLEGLGAEPRSLLCRDPALAVTLQAQVCLRGGAPLLTLLHAHFGS